jgi:hypothetical protein
VGDPGEQMMTFAASMALLASAGIPVAQFELVAPEVGRPTTSLTGPLVVKLADVAHRTEHNAVSIGVDSSALESEVDRLRKIAAANDLPATVVIQPQIFGNGEAFIGLSGSTELGPTVAFGLGGVFIEVFRRISGRLAPIDQNDADDLLAEFDDLGVIDGFRGGVPWDRRQLTEILIKVSHLVAGGRHWIDTMDVNPLIVTNDGLVAVDCVCFVRPEVEARA